METVVILREIHVILREIHVILGLTSEWLKGKNKKMIN